MNVDQHAMTRKRIETTRPRLEANSQNAGCHVGAGGNQESTQRRVPHEHINLSPKGPSELTRPIIALLHSESVTSELRSPPTKAP